MNLSSHGYESSPACIMLATHCAACGKPLVDSISVNSGMGPDCRKKHGYNVDVSPEARAEANAIVHSIALDRHSLTSLEGCARLHTLGFVKLAQVISERIAEIVIEILADGRYSVETPYSADAVVVMRRIRGRRWDADAKRNTFPAEARGELFTALKSLYPGSLGIGPKGPFRL